MSMKKKFLALALAGMVAMPVVANATQVSGSQTMEGELSDTPTADLRINGNVTNNTNQAPAGRIQVELPTAMSFTVDANGVFKSASNFQIRNTGQEPVKVEVMDFLEDDESAGIKVSEYTSVSTDKTSKPRSEVGITLTGDGSAVDLAQAKSSSQVLFTRLGGGNIGTVKISGIAGTDTSGSNKDNTAETSGVQEDFTVQFKITHVQ